MLYQHSITNPRLCSGKVLRSRPKCPRSPSLIISGGGSSPVPPFPLSYCGPSLAGGPCSVGFGTRARNTERRREEGKGLGKFLGFPGVHPRNTVAVGRGDRHAHTHPRKEVGKKKKWKGDKNRRFNCRPCLSSEITRACNTLDTAHEKPGPTAQMRADK